MDETTNTLFSLFINQTTIILSILPISYGSRSILPPLPPILIYSTLNSNNTLKINDTFGQASSISPFSNILVTSIAIGYDTYIFACDSSGNKLQEFIIEDIWVKIAVTGIFLPNIFCEIY